MSVKQRIFDAPDRGFDPLRIARDGAVIDGQKMMQAGSYLNSMAGTRLKCLGRAAMRPSDYPSTTSDITIYRFLFHTSPNAEEICINAVGCSVDSTTSTDAVVYYVLKTADLGFQPAALSTVSTSADIHIIGRVTAGSTIVPDNFCYLENEIDCTGNTTYALEVHTKNLARILSISVYERSHEGKYLDTYDRLVVDTTRFKFDSPIYDVDLAAMLNNFKTMWNRGGASHFSWSYNSTNGTTTTSASYVNIFDATKTAWGASNPGFWVWPKYKGRLSTSQEPVVCWVYGTTKGAVTFVTNGATVGVCGVEATEGYYTTTGYLNAANTSDKIDLLFKNSSGGTTTVYNAGCYDYNA